MELVEFSAHHHYSTIYLLGKHGADMVCANIVNAVLKEHTALQDYTNQLLFELSVCV